MKKAFVCLALMGAQYLLAQVDKKPVFSMGPMVRMHGIYPINFGDNYLADANNPKVSFGMSLSLFDVYGFRLYGGIDHLYYMTTDVSRAAHIARTKYTGIYGTISYEIPIAKAFTVEPYMGGGWVNLKFKRPNETSTNFYSDFDNVGISSQQGAEFRTGVYLDYKIHKAVAVFSGLAYVRGLYEIDTAAEFRDYFGKSEMLQVSVGVKIGYTAREKMRDRAAQDNTN